MSLDYRSLGHYMNNWMNSKVGLLVTIRIIEWIAKLDNWSLYKWFGYDEDSLLMGAKAGNCANGQLALMTVISRLIQCYLNLVYVSTYSPWLSRLSISQWFVLSNVLYCEFSLMMSFSNSFVIAGALDRL